MISISSGGYSTSIFSNSSSWRYGFTSSEYLVRNSTASIDRLSQIVFMVCLSLPGDAVRARIFSLVACCLYFCATRLYA